MKRTPLRRRSKDYQAKQKVKKDKEKALLEEYGIKISYWRYKGRKGIYWHLLSKYVRLRDFKAYGTCISCGKKFKEWREAQGGHYAPAKDCGFELLFDERNVHAECSSCNNPFISPGKLIKYRANLVDRYGEDYVKEVDSLYSQKLKGKGKEWTQKEYDAKIKELMGKLKEFGDV